MCDMFFPIKQFSLNLGPLVIIIIIISPITNI